VSTLNEHVHNFSFDDLELGIVGEKKRNVRKSKTK
jgi:hypothetical protein